MGRRGSRLNESQETVRNSFVILSRAGVRGLFLCKTSSRVRFNPFHATRTNRTDASSTVNREGRMMERGGGSVLTLI
jgi:hypothetical protein